MINFRKGSLNVRVFALSAAVLLVGTMLVTDMLRLKQSSLPGLPAPAQRVTVSAASQLPVLTGLRLDPADPLRIEFLIARGDQRDVARDDVERLVSYFLAGLTTPDEDLWVNLSPDESDRVLAEGMETTDLGRDLLAQDYILKQLASSLTHPDTETGREYWAHSGAGTPFMASSNKIWIVPDKAEVHADDRLALVTGMWLKVRSESPEHEVLLPTIEKDVNEGANFTRLRQICHALILATWFKARVRDSLYAAYIDAHKLKGIDTSDPALKEKIFNLYVESFKKGVYDVVRRSVDSGRGQLQGEKNLRFFSGGAHLAFAPVMETGAITAEDRVRMNSSALLVAGMDMVPALAPEPATEPVREISSSALTAQGYRFPQWLADSLRDDLARALFAVLSMDKAVDDVAERQERAVSLSKEGARFIADNGGLCFRGTADDVPEGLRDALCPVSIGSGYVLCEGVLDVVAEVFKRSFVQYDGVDIPSVIDRFRKTLDLHVGISSRADLQLTGDEVKRLEGNIRNVLPGGERDFSVFIKASARQYGLDENDSEAVLRELLVQTGVNALCYKTVPRLLDAGGVERELTAPLLRVLNETISSRGLLPTGPESDAYKARLAELTHEQEFRQKLSGMIDDVFEDLAEVRSGTEQELSFYGRVNRAMKKLRALSHGRVWDFQDEQRYRREGKQPVAAVELDKMSRLVNHLENRYGHMLPVALAFMDIGKVAKFKALDKYSHLDFSNHPEAGAYIMQHEGVCEQLGLDDRISRIAQAIVRHHGFIGQSKRGEVADEVFEPILQLALEEGDDNIIDAYFLANVIDTSMVREGLMDAAMFDWFSQKTDALKKIVAEARSRSLSVAAVLAERAALIDADTELQREEALKRINAMLPAHGPMRMTQALERVFAAEPEAKTEFFRLLARRRASFSLWYPESALGGLSPEAAVKVMYLSLRAAERGTSGERGGPLDVDFFGVASETGRRDESRLAVENRDYLERLASDVTVSEIADDAFIDKVMTGGLDGLLFKRDAVHATLRVDFKALAVLGTDEVSVEARIARLQGRVTAGLDRESLFFVKNAGYAGKQVGVFVADCSPVSRRDKAVINALKERYGLDEVVLVIPDGTKEQYGFSTAERVFLAQEEFEGMDGVSIAVSKDVESVTVTASLRSMRPAGTRFHAVIDSEALKDAFEEDRSRVTRKAVKELFDAGGRMVVAPRGYFQVGDIPQVLLEKKIESFSDRISGIDLGRSVRFESGVDTRLQLVNGGGNIEALSARVLRYVKALNMIGGETRGVGAQPVAVTFVTTTSPDHQVPSEPLGVDSLMGQLRNRFGSEVDTSLIDTQRGVTPEEVVRRLRRTQPQVICLSAQLESDRRLFAILDLLRKEPWYRRKKPHVFIGGNLVTNDAARILNKYPDAVCVKGEGERAIVEIMRYVRGESTLRDIPAAAFVEEGMIIQNPGAKVDLKQVALPARDVLYEMIKNGDDIWVETSRGCGWGVCSFCFKDPFRAHEWEPYDDDTVISMFEELYRAGARQVSLSDPEFFGGGKRTEEGLDRALRLAPRLKKLAEKYGYTINVAFSTRADTVYRDYEPDERDLLDLRRQQLTLEIDCPDAHERLERDRKITALIAGKERIIAEKKAFNEKSRQAFLALREGGFINAFLGTESGSGPQLKRFRKGVTVAENERAIHLLREYGYRICSGYIILDPLATVDDILENTDFVVRNDSFVEISFPLNQMKVQVGTPYHVMARLEGLLGDRSANVHTFESIYKHQDVQNVADIISRFGREIGSVFYVLKYLYRTKTLNDEPGEAAAAERKALYDFFDRYNRQEVAFARALAIATLAPQERRKYKDEPFLKEYGCGVDFGDDMPVPDKLREVVVKFRIQRVVMVREVEAAIQRGLIRDEKGTLKGEIDRIRKLVSQGDEELSRVPRLTNKELARYRRYPALYIKKLLADPRLRDSEDLMAELAILLDRAVKNGDSFIDISDVPVIRPQRSLRLLVDVSDDGRKVRYYEVLDDKDLFAEDGSVLDRSKIRPLFRGDDGDALWVDSFGLTHPDNHIAQRFGHDYADKRNEDIARLNMLMQSGGVYSRYRGLVTGYDGRVDLDVWRTNGDTVHFLDVLHRIGDFDDRNTRRVLEVGSGDGRIIAAAAKNGVSITDADSTDVSFFAGNATKRNIESVVRARGIKTRQIAGKGIEKLDGRYDRIYASPPYIPQQGTGLIRELIEQGVHHLNVDNPNAAMYMKYSSLADAEVAEYLRAYGDLFDVEVVDEGYELPLKIAMDDRWVERLRERGGLIEKDPAHNGGFAHWHRLRVIRLKPKQLTLDYKNGSSRTIPADIRVFGRERFNELDLNGLSLHSKLMLAALFSPEHRPWFDAEWDDMFDLCTYYEQDVLPGLKGAMEAQLERPVQLSVANLLRELYEPGRFMNRNIVNEIYFSGREPALSAHVKEARREGINNADADRRAAVMRLICEHLESFGWNEGIGQYLEREYGYRGTFSVVGVRDYGIGTSVYRLTLRFDDEPNRADVELYIKRKHPGDGLENEMPALEIEHAMLEETVGHAIDRRGYIHAAAGDLPGLYIAPVIVRESLDTRLTAERAADADYERRITEIEILRNVECVEGTLEYIVREVALATRMLASQSAAERLKAVETLARYRDVIRRSDVLAGAGDFHAHTIHSDGGLSPAELVVRAWLNGAQSVAVTDHMTFEGVVEAMETAELLGSVTVVPGIELYTREDDAGVGPLHTVVYLPQLRTSQHVRVFLDRLEADDDPQLARINAALRNRTEDTERIRQAFNVRFREQGMEIPPDAFKQSGPTLMQFAEYLRRTYHGRFLGLTVSEIKARYIDLVKFDLLSVGPAEIPFEEAVRFGVLHGGVVSPAHVLRMRQGRSVPEQIALIRKVLEKYATVTMPDGTQRLGVRAIGLYGSGNSSDDHKALRRMMAELERDHPVYRLFRLTAVNESDYHYGAVGEFFVGRKSSDGTYSVPVSRFSPLRLVDLRRQSGLVASVTGDPSTAVGDKTAYERLLEAVIVAGARQAALGDLLGFNDRRLGNYRVDVDDDGELRSLIAFDNPQMLDHDSRLGDEDWMINYDWNVQDAAMGIHELAWVTLGDEFDTGAGARAKLLEAWIDAYGRTWDRLTTPESIRRIESALREHFSAEPQKIADKIHVLHKRIDAGRESYLRTLLEALLNGYETRRLYRRTLDRIAAEKGKEALGDLRKYLSPAPGDSLAVEMEHFRGILPQRFLERYRMNRTSLEHFYARIDELVLEQLGAGAVGELHQSRRDIEAEAAKMIAELLPKQAGSGLVNKGGIDLAGFTYRIHACGNVSVASTAVMPGLEGMSFDLLYLKPLSEE